MACFSFLCLSPLHPAQAKRQCTRQRVNSSNVGFPCENAERQTASSLVELVSDPASPRRSLPQLSCTTAGARLSGSARPLESSREPYGIFWPEIRRRNISGFETPSWILF